jgi:hypothetical protein
VVTALAVVDGKTEVSCGNAGGVQGAAAATALQVAVAESVDDQQHDVRAVSPRLTFSSRSGA